MALDQIDKGNRNLQKTLTDEFNQKLSDLKESLCVQNEVDCHIETDEKADDEGVFKDLGKWLHYQNTKNRK